MWAEAEGGRGRPWGLMPACCDLGHMHMQPLCSVAGSKATQNPSTLFGTSRKTPCRRKEKKRKQDTPRGRKIEDEKMKSGKKWNGTTIGQKSVPGYQTCYLVLMPALLGRVRRLEQRHALHQLHIIPHHCARKGHHAFVTQEQLLEEPSATASKRTKNKK